MMKITDTNSKGPNMEATILKTCLFAFCSSDETFGTETFKISSLL